MNKNDYAKQNFKNYDGLKSILQTLLKKIMRFVSDTCHIKTKTIAQKIRKFSKIAGCMTPVNDSILKKSFAYDPKSKFFSDLNSSKTMALRTGGSSAAAASKMECFVIIVNGFQPLTIITKHSILDVAAALDPPLGTLVQVCMVN